MRISDWSSDVCSSDLSLIDRARLGRFAGHPLLGAADYKLVHHAKNGRSVYSFCMCPGGTVVAATSEAGRVVTNGMSQYSRNERNANAGIVVGISPEDYPGGVDAGPLAGIARSEEHTSELQSLMRISYAVFCLKKKITNATNQR